MKEETKANLGVVFMGLILGLLAFLFTQKREESKNKAADAPSNYSEKDLI
jgi:hypothetical protein